MQINNKSYFRLLAETGSITAAAKILRVSQPALSQYVSRLENKIGTKLIDFSTTPAKLTEAGLIYLKYVKESEKIDSEFERNIANCMANRDQIFTLGIPSNIASYVFNSHILEYVKSHPQVRISYKVGTSSYLKELLNEHKVDMAFIYTYTPYSENMETMILAQSNATLVCSEDCPITGGRHSSNGTPIVLSKKEIEYINTSMELVTLPDNSYLSEITANYLRSSDIDPARQISVPNVETAIHYIKQNPMNDSISMLPVFPDNYREEEAGLAFFVAGKDIPKWSLTFNRLAKTPSEISDDFWNYMTVRNQ